MRTDLDPLASFITWSCYGTHLHGDSDGSVTQDWNRYGTPYLHRNEAIREFESRLLRASPLTLTPEMRAIVEQVIRAHCEIRRWRLWAVNARTTHVHVVLTAPTDTRPNTAEGQLKAWCTRRLREAGLIDANRPVWTRHGSTRQLWNERALAEAIDYVLNRQ